MFRSLMLSVALLSSVAAATAPAFAQSQGFPSPFDTRGTPEDEKACRGDAVKLCRDVLGNDMAVLACFQRQRQKLSRACNAVLVKYGQ